MTMGLHGWSRVEDNISKAEIEWTENQIIGRIIYMYIELDKNPDSSSIGEDDSDPVIKIVKKWGVSWMVILDTWLQIKIVCVILSVGFYVQWRF